MKNLFPLLFLTATLVQSAKAQLESPPAIEAYFTALIVEDIDRSIEWYTETLGFQVIDKKEFPDHGFKQANLQLDHALLELIQIESAKKPAKIIPDYNSKTKIQGIFKTGFRVEDFDRWLKRLKNLEVRFHGNVAVNQLSGKKMLILLDPDGNRIQLFEK